MMRTPTRSKRPSQQPIILPASIPAPVRGWNARDPESAMPPGYALYLDNWWPEATKVRVRDGSIAHATGLPSKVFTLCAYNPRSGTKKLFACVNSGIYDATSAGAVGAAVATITTGKVSYTNFTASGATYLLIVNGTDDMQKYDGTTWSTVATLPKSVGNLNLNTISYIAAHKRRLFFVEKGSSVVWYLPIDSVSGTVASFDFGGIMTKGGYVVAMGTWTVDGGSGIDDLAVFITSEGQAIVYQGTNPASDWALIGVFDLPRPVGTRPLYKYGGDLIYLCEQGVSLLSKALRGDPSEQTALVSDNISTPFVEATTLYSANFGWQAITLPTANALIVNIPTVDGTTSVQFVMNTKTGAWASFSGWNGFCWEVLGNQLYYGGNLVVNRAWTGAADLGGSITAIAKTAFSYLNGPGLKQIRLHRPLIKVTGLSALNSEIDTDFSDNTTYNAPVFSGPGGALWGSAVWGTSTWGGNATPRLDWLTAACAPGYCAAARLRSISSNATVEWTSTDILYEPGAAK